MRTTTPLALAFGLTLAATLPAQAQQKMSPGLWETTMNVKSDGQDMSAQMAQMKAEMAKMPPEQRKMMEEMMAKQGVSMGGGAVRANNFLIDGFPVTDLQNRASTNPTMEAIQDMKVQVHTYDAEMGRTGGGVMNMAARSGSNQWHGSGYTVIRPTAWMQNLLIPQLRGQAFVPEYWRNGGGGVGDGHGRHSPSKPEANPGTSFRQRLRP